MHKGQLDSNTQGHRVDIIESERGWGQKIIETLHFDTRENADAFINGYNARNTGNKVPDYYTRADYVGGPGTRSNSVLRKVKKTYKGPITGAEIKIPEKTPPSERDILLDILASIEDTNRLLIQLVNKAYE